MPYFTIVKGPTPGAIIPITGKSEDIGRSADCEITLDVPSISRRHARYYIDNGKRMLEDLNSRNGTFVNNVRLESPVELREDDLIQLCDLTMSFHTGGSAQAQAGSVKIIDTDNDPSFNVESSFKMDGEFGMEAQGESASRVCLDIDEIRAARKKEADDSRESRHSKLLETLGTPEEVDDDKSSILSSISVSPFKPASRSGIHAATKLKAILQLMKNLGQNLNLDEVMEKILDSLFIIFPNADHGLIVLRGENSCRLIPTAVKHRHPTPGPIRISRTVFNNVMNDKTAVLSADILNDSRFNAAQSIMNLSYHSMMCAPLIDAEGQVLGAIKLDSDIEGKRFKPEDLELLASVAVQAALYVRNAQLHVLAIRDAAIEQELKLAYKVQKALLPECAPEIDGYDFFNVYLPARHLGGDYYDYFSLPDGRVAIVQADVAGKGITASLLMAKLSADAKFTLMSSKDPVEVVARLNHLVCSKDLEGKFITLILILLDSVNHKIQIVNAGHNPPVSRKSDGATELVSLLGEGMPLGVSVDSVYSSFERNIDPGEMLFFYTDGLTDAMNTEEEFFSIDRVQDKISRPFDNIADCGNALMADIKEYIGSAQQTDDICVVGIERKK